MSFNPARTRLQWYAAQDESGGTNTPANEHRYQPLLISVGPDYGLAQIESEAISDRQTPAAEAGTISPRLEPELQFEPHNCGGLVAHAIGYSTTTGLGSGAYKHVISMASGDNYASGAELIAQLYREETERVATFPGGIVGGLTFSHGTDSLLKFKPQLLFSSAEEFGPIEADGDNTGTAPAPYIRGAQLEAAQAAGLDWTITITAMPSATAGDADVRIERTGMSGSVVVPVTSGRWESVKFRDGSIPGLNPADVEIKFPDLADAAVGDAWTMTSGYAEADAFAAVSPVPQAFSSVYAEVYLDGIKLGSGTDGKAETFELSYTQETAWGHGVGGRFSPPYTKGAPSISIKLGRRYLDERIARKTRAGQSFHFKYRAVGPIIGSSSLRYELQIICPEAKNVGQRPTPSDGATWQEDMELAVGKPTAADGEGYGDMITVVIVNSAATLF